MKAVYREKTLAAIVILCALLPAIVLYKDYVKTTLQTASVPTLGEVKVKQLTERLNQLVELPSSEPPRFAKVDDPKAINDALFFVDLQKDDEILYYDKSQKVIVYRPSTDRVVGQYPDGAFPTRE